ncbi:hypothetical protein OPU71_02065 [Niveibacterium sp. 24ML]|uniref:hypothetical protein n=1 Tax=Niveibacterium sp. 24ML TaxID=2985512 RepID=UPI00226E648B|nr:hypothetical protein [Niveibacterium sp. 24ML]MCX9154904.1 hypothetical protein [Niveibacterium sp. 24ML]
MTQLRSIAVSRKRLLALASALVLLGGLGWTLAHAGEQVCAATAGLEHDRILLVLHSNGAEAAVPRLPSLAP